MQAQPHTPQTRAHTLISSCVSTYILYWFVINLDRIIVYKLPRLLNTWEWKAVKYVRVGRETQSIFIFLRVKRVIFFVQLSIYGIKTKNYRYGKIFTINLVGKPAIVSADTKLTKLVLQNEMRLFEDAWPAAFRDVIGETNIALQVGDAHRQLKSIILNFISEGKHSNSIFQENVDRVAEQIFGSWRDGSTVSIFTAAKQVIYLNCSYWWWFTLLR